MGNDGQFVILPQVWARAGRVMRALGLLTLIVLVPLSLACTGQAPAATPVSAPTEPPDLAATVQAAVSAALPTPTTDIEATIAAGIEATRAAVPSPTPTLLPTPDIEATVAARMAATVAAVPPPSNTPLPTASPPPHLLPPPHLHPRLLPRRVPRRRPGQPRLRVPPTPPYLPGLRQAV